MRPAILVLSVGGVATATRIRDALPGAEMLGLAGRVEDVETTFEDMTGTVQALFEARRPIIGLCAAGILIRMIAPLLGEKREEAPVLAVSEDGAVVVPLLGGLTGGNELAATIAAALGTTAAITGSGARRFGLILERPPPGWTCVNPDDAKRVTADLLGGATARIEGDLPWLMQASLPLSPAGEVILRSSEISDVIPERGLLFRPAATSSEERKSEPEGRDRVPGKVAVIGLGPGSAEWLTPQARRELEQASDIIGYAPYIAMIPPELTAGKISHASDNREELARAQSAMRLAAKGGRVAIVSSGDPGIFAMAAALLEALEAPEPGWTSVEIAIAPGISAMQAAAARVGAPLGHDFAVLSLSDNLKPWELILRRLDACLAADLALALYNPVSRARPHRLGEAMGRVARHRSAATPIVLGSDVGRPGERIRVVALGEFEASMADSRTVILVGSSQTRRVTLGDREFVLTPRSYPDG